MDYRDFKEYIKEPKYPSQKLVRAERYFQKYGYDFVVKRKNEWAVILLATKDKLKRILNLVELNVRRVDITKFLCKFFEDSLDMIKYYEKVKSEESSRFIVGKSDNAKIVLNDKEIPLESGQEVKVFS